MAKEGEHPFVAALAAEGLVHNDLYVCVPSRTPKAAKKVAGALAAYGRTGGLNVTPEEVVCVYDGTVFGSCSDGFLLTDTHLLSHNMWEDAHAAPLAAITAVDVASGTALSVSAGHLGHKITIIGFSEGKMHQLAHALLAFAHSRGSAGAALKAPPPAAPLPRGGPDLTYDDALTLMVSCVQFSENALHIGRVKPKKRRNAAEKYGAHLMQADDILLLYDNTVFGSARDGFSVSRTAFGYNNMAGSSDVVPLELIESVTAKGSHVVVQTPGRAHEVNINIAAGSTGALATQLASAVSKFVEALRVPAAGAGASAPPAGAGAGDHPPPATPALETFAANWQASFEAAASTEELLLVFELLLGAVQVGALKLEKPVVIELSVRKRESYPAAWTRDVAQHFGKLLERL